MVIYSFSSTFENCISLESIDLSVFNGIENLMNVNNMFANCTSLKQIEFPTIKASGLKSTSNMFFGCSKLEYIDIGNFLTSSNLKNLDNMFYNCSSLIFLNISQLYTGNLQNVYNIFHGVNKPIRLIIYEDVDEFLKQEISKLTIINETEFELF